MKTIPVHFDQNTWADGDMTISDGAARKLAELFVREETALQIVGTVAMVSGVKRLESVRIIGLPTQTPHENSW